MTIYEIDSRIMDCIDEETGEVIDFEMLEKLIQDKHEKVENIALWYKNTVAEAEAIKAEINSLTARKKRDENLAESLKIYLKNVLNGEKFKTPKVSISYRKSSSVEVDDVFGLPEEFITYKTPEPKKAEIKKAILRGEIIKGARIVENSNIQIK